MQARKAYFMVRAHVPNESDRAKFDQWYGTHHLGQVPCRERLALLEPQRRIGPLCALPVQRHGNAARPSRLPGLQAAHRRFRSGMAGSRAQPRPDRKRARGLKACDAARQAMNAWLAVPAPARGTTSRPQDLWTAKSNA